MSVVTAWEVHKALFLIEILAVFGNKPIDIKAMCYGAGSRSRKEKEERFELRRSVECFRSLSSVDI